MEIDDEIPTILQTSLEIFMKEFQEESGQKFLRDSLTEFMKNILKKNLQQLLENPW